MELFEAIFTHEISKYASKITLEMLLSSLLIARYYCKIWWVQSCIYQYNLVWLFNLVNDENY